MSKKVFILLAGVLLFCVGAFNPFGCKGKINGKVTKGGTAVDGAIVIRIGAAIDDAQAILTAMEGLQGGSITEDTVKTAVETATDSASIDVTTTDSTGNYEFTDVDFGPQVVAAVDTAGSAAYEPVEPTGIALGSFEWTKDIALPAQ